jgi:hypothetical protein
MIETPEVLIGTPELVFRAKQDRAYVASVAACMSTPNVSRNFEVMM